MELIGLSCFLQIQLHPHHLPLLAHLGACLDKSAKGSAAAAAHKEAAQQASAAATQPPASRSIIEGMLLPDTTAFATEFMTRSWAYNQSSDAVDSDEVISSFTERLCVSTLAEPDVVNDMSDHG